MYLLKKVDHKAVLEGEWPKLAGKAEEGLKVHPEYSGQVPSFKFQGIDGLIE
jgi:hypothetical protein